VSPACTAIKLTRQPTISSALLGRSRQLALALFFVQSAQLDMHAFNLVLSAAQPLSVLRDISV